MVFNPGTDGKHRMQASLCSCLLLLLSFLWLWALRNPCRAGSPVLSRSFTAHAGAGLLASSQHWGPRVFQPSPSSPPPLLRVPAASCGLRGQLLEDWRALHWPPPSSSPCPAPPRPAPGQPSRVAQAYFQVSRSLTLPD